MLVSIAVVGIVAGIEHSLALGIATALFAAVALSMVVSGKVHAVLLLVIILPGIALSSHSADAASMPTSAPVVASHSVYPQWGTSCVDSMGAVFASNIVLWTVVSAGTGGWGIFAAGFGMYMSMGNAVDNCNSADYGIPWYEPYYWNSYGGYGGGGGGGSW